MSHSELLRLSALLSSLRPFPKGMRELEFSPRDYELLRCALPGELDSILGYRVKANRSIPQGFAVCLGAARAFIGILDLRDMRSAILPTHRQLDRALDTDGVREVPVVRAPSGRLEIEITGPSERGDE